MVIADFSGENKIKVIPSVRIVFEKKVCYNVPEYVQNSAWDGTGG